jgi:hypothetical protein
MTGNNRHRVGGVRDIRLCRSNSPDDAAAGNIVDERIVAMPPGVRDVHDVSSGEIDGHLPFAGALAKARIERRSVSGEADWGGQNQHSGSAERPKRAALPLQRGQRDLRRPIESAAFIRQ